MTGRYLDALTWKEAEAALAVPGTVVLLPLGARLKEHGLHLPLNNDWLLAEYLTARILERVPVLALPTVPFHYFPAFVEYPGSVHLELETSRRVVVDVCRSLARAGARRFYVLNTGVSTDRALQPAQEDLEKDGLAFRYTRLLDLLHPIAAPLQQQEGGTHADEIETSMMLYIAPHVVDMTKAVKDFHASRGPGPLTRNPDALTGVFSPSGAWGDPTLATVEKGRQIVEALVEALVADVSVLSVNDWTEL